MPSGHGLGIKSGETWAYRTSYGSTTFYRCTVIDPGDHYRAQIRVMVHEGKAHGIRYVGREKLPCKWDAVEEFASTHPGVVRFEELPDVVPETPAEVSFSDLVQTFEGVVRRVVREEVTRYIEQPRKLSYTYDEAAVAIGVSDSTLRTYVAAGDLIPRYIRSRPVFLPAELEAWLESLPYDPR